MVVSTRKNRWFVECEPPSDAAIAAVLQKISHRVIRTLRRLGYLEAGMDAAVATAYDPLLDNEPKLVRTMAASVTQRIAFGERAGEPARVSRVLRVVRAHNGVSRSSSSSLIVRDSGD